LTITYEPRAGDARALVISLACGALIGVAIGGAYVVGGVAREAVSKPLTAQANRVQIPDPSARSALASPAQTGPALSAPFSEPMSPVQQPVSLRDRFSLALALTRSVVQPFHFKTDDAGEEDHSRDAQCLAQAVYYEARGESGSGQAAVAQVVLNRVRHPAFPKTVCGVVFQHVGDDCQFSFACNGAMRQPLDRAAWRRAMAVADRALSGAVMAQVGSATHFQAARSSAGWAGSLAKVAQIGAHIFYRFTGRTGAASMFHAEPQRSTGDIALPLGGDASPAHEVQTAAAAPQAPAPPTDTRPQTPDMKASASVSAPTPSTPVSKTTESTAKAPAGDGAKGAQPVKAVEPETSKPIGATPT
jgi:spore germination cell wall hydrolase CwlJ-like protein